MRVAMIGQKGIPVTIGGPENFVREISTRLVRRGHRVTVYCRPYALTEWARFLSEEEKEAVRQRKYEGVDLKILPTVPTKRLDAIVHSTLSSIHCVFDSFDVLHYHTIGAFLPAFIPRLATRAKIVVSVHALDWQRAKWGRGARAMLRLGEEASIRIPDVTHVISRELKRYFESRSRHSQKIVYIPTGVNVAEPKPTRLTRKYGIREGKYILFLSRLVPEKGAHYLIDAYNRLETDMKLVIAGNALYEPGYVGRLKASAGRGVVFTGFVPDEEMAELFSNAYFYVLPSETEGLPHTLLQALSYGRCVVASDIEANREALGGLGFTFTSKDSKDLGKVLEKLIANPKLVASEQGKGIKRVRKEYGWEAVVDRFEQVYHN
ncbi:glycosyltransferase family 4 protein [bacterium]|nr:glycosyltransferase family 4 protein [bacterium]